MPMARSAPRFHLYLLQEMLRFKPRDVPYSVALRNTVGFLLPLAVGAWSGHVEAGAGIAVGTLNVMFSDRPGPYRLRLQRMMSAALIAGLSAFVGFSLGDNDVLIVIAIALCGFAGAMLVALGPEAARVGLTSMILLIVCSAEPRAPQAALLAAGLIFSGGLLQTLLAIAAWPLQRYRPERYALAAVYAELATNARQRQESHQAPPLTEAINNLQILLHGAHRARGMAMDAFRVLAAVAERLRIELLALTDLREQFSLTLNQQRIEQLLTRSADVLDAIADALRNGAAPLYAETLLLNYQAVLPKMIAARDSGQGVRNTPLMHIACARAIGLGGQLRAAIRNANYAGSRGELAAQEVELRLPQALQPGNPLATLRANLSLSSIACRHALRCATCLALAISVERMSGLTHGYWIPMTLAIVLKPDFGGTFIFALLRVIGTLVGLLLATALVHFAFGDIWERILLLGLLCFAFRELAAMHYGIAIAMLTGLIVVLLSLLGEAAGDTMLARGIGTIAGSALALLAYALWPTWERSRIHLTLTTLIESYRHYFATLFEDDERTRIDARTAARIARTNVQASLERLRAEPQGDPKLSQLAEDIVSNSNRFARAAMSLEAELQATRVLPQPKNTLAFSARISTALSEIATALRSHQPLAVTAELREYQQVFAQKLESTLDLPEQRNLALALIHASDRITDSVDTLRHLLETHEPISTLDSTLALAANTDLTNTEAANRFGNR